VSNQEAVPTERPPAQPPPLEHLQWQHDLARQDAHRAHDNHTKFWTDVNEAAIKSSDTALRMAMLINGGAAVSVLAFIGGLVARDRIAMADLRGCRTA
jgi:hypothetical protein